MCVENKIAYYCENNNMTIAELAQKLKVKERAVLQWEKGVKFPILMKCGNCLKY